MHGLIIREPWLGYILNGTKTWEMRTTPASRRGRIALIRKGSGLIVGTAEIVDSLPPLDAAGLTATRDRHCIPPELDTQVLAAGWVHPWVLRDVRGLPSPVPACQKPGQVIWVPLAPDVVAAAEVQMGEVLQPSVSAMEAQQPVQAEASAPAGTISDISRVAHRLTDDMDEVTVKLTDGAIRNSNLSIRNALHLLPEGVVGGSRRDSAAACQLTVVFHPGETVETDIAGDKMLLRGRGAVADFYARAGAKGGDLVRMQGDRSGTLHVRACQKITALPRCRSSRL